MLLSCPNLPVGAVEFHPSLPQLQRLLDEQEAQRQENIQRRRRRRRRLLLNESNKGLDDADNADDEDDNDDNDHVLVTDTLMFQLKSNLSPLQQQAILTVLTTQLQGLCQTPRRLIRTADPTLNPTLFQKHVSYGFHLFYHSTCNDDNLVAASEDNDSFASPSDQATSAAGDEMLAETTDLQEDEDGSFQHDSNTTENGSTNKKGEEDMVKNQNHVVQQTTTSSPPGSGPQKAMLLLQQLLLDDGGNNDDNDNNMTSTMVNNKDDLEAGEQSHDDNDLASLRSFISSTSPSLSSSPSFEEETNTTTSSTRTVASILKQGLQRVEVDMQIELVGNHRNVRHFRQARSSSKTSRKSSGDVDDSNGDHRANHVDDDVSMIWQQQLYLNSYSSSLRRDLANSSSQMPNDPLYDQQLNLQLIQMPHAWNLMNNHSYLWENTNDGSSGHRGRRLSPIIVQVTDSGLDLTHPDIGDYLWSHVGEENCTDGIDDDGNGFPDDCHGYNHVHDTGRDHLGSSEHGAHCSGIIAANTDNHEGVAGIVGGGRLQSGSSSQGDYGIRLMTSVIFGRGGAARGFAEALIYGVDNGAVISSNSWGYKSVDSFGEPVRLAIDYAVDNNVLVLFAAGNAKSNASFYPAYYYKTIAVGAVQFQDKKACGFTNYGPWLNISAPGNGVWSLEKDGGYRSAAGTSQACPHVAAVLAMGKRLYPEASPKDLTRCLYSSATDLDAYQPD
ncbi:hypothetical protein ACA910_020383 [Epithemia clementina (nom. ined.)]